MPLLDPTAAAVPTPFSNARGEMAQRMRELAWEKTPMGPVDAWPASLKSLVMMLLECQLPMYIAWGPRFTQFYNDAYRPILGAKHPAALGNSAAVTWSEIWDTIHPMWQEAMGGEPIGFDDFKLTIERYGYPEECYFNFSYSAVRDDEGRASGVLVTFAETTKRVLTERRLRFLDELSQSTRAVAHPADAMRLASSSLGQYLGANRCAYARVLPDEDTFDLIGDYNERVSSIVGRYRFSDFGAEVLRLMRANEAYVNPDVDRHPVTAGADLSAYRQTQIQAVICVPLHKNGKLVAAMAVHQSVPRAWTEQEIELVETVVDRCWDALERLRAEAALHDEARCLELLNRTGSDLSAELELEALLQRATDAATQLTGATFGAFCYRGIDAHGDEHLLYTFSGTSREAFQTVDRLNPTVLFRPASRGELPIRSSDVLADARYSEWAPHLAMRPGHPPLRSCLAVPVIGRLGELIGALFFGHPETAIFSERSERLALGVASQAAIAIDNARLYARAQREAEERSHLLDSERAARAAAERLSTVKDEFLATLSHELRTPLSAITGWSHILKRKLQASDPQLLRGIEVIERSTQLQVQLIEDLLDMSRITAGKLPLDMQPVAPVSFVQSAIDVILPSADAAGVRIETFFEPVNSVLGDARRLQQVVWNLVSNAVKFTPRGGVIRVDLHSVDGHAEIRVADTGVGIPAQALPQLFERFRQGDGSITRRFGGLGLGLSLVRSLIEMHCGTVTAHSEGEGRGATFVVRVPLLSYGEDRRLVPMTASPPSDWGSLDRAPTLHGTRILLVEDDSNTAELLIRIIEEQGARVHWAKDAEAALEAVQHFGPVVLISDIGLPGTDGYELMRRVRRLPADQGGRVPAIALTAFARDKDRERAFAAGYSAHLTKPLLPNAVLGLVARLCAETPADR
ncbi:hybrid sensor histidine kinase/response regulator [Eleftheria terrae]|uniref:hybrid sensor histidine kinase/response regulator n=1 Tax=Eleftheria terrae TaxID=1597781 RepID=UPI00263ADC93|nr:ATP-binding protein [Eleftheria terrae]WKB56108.1 ATP-binding protein [Eleftheria terrae]